MAETFEQIDDRLAGWIGRQALFFVATAPLAPDGHVNVSPKGPIGTLAVLGPHRVAYLDFFGSGTETVAHLRENGRIVIMLCAFDGPPRILRLHGRGHPIWPDEPDFDALLDEAGFEELTEVTEARRAIVAVDVERVATSCGYGVPLLDHVGEREHYDLHRQKGLRTKGADGLRDHLVGRGSRSLDGLPAVPEPARRG